MYFERIIDDYRKKGRKFYPAPQESIDKLLEAWEHLPPVYMEFLRTMGGGQGIVNQNTPPERDGFMVGEDFYINELFGLKEAGIELLKEDNSPYTLKDDDFIFWMSQRVMFAFFNINEGYDPPVYFYSEGDPNGVKKVSDSFSEFIWNMYRSPAKALRAAGNSDYDKSPVKQTEKTAKKVLEVVAAVCSVSLLIFLLYNLSFLDL